MVYHVAKIGIAPLERHDDAIFEQLRDAPNTFSHVTEGHVCLLEIGVRLIDHDGDTLLQFPIQPIGYLLIAFRGSC